LKVEAYDWLIELEKVNFDVFHHSLAKVSTYSTPKKMMDFGKRGEY